MDSPSVSVGLLATAADADERPGAAAWCRDDAVNVEELAPATLRRDDAAPPEYDVLWWHDDEPPDAADVEARAPAVRSHLDDGGGLLLSLRALAAVDELGIDPVPPDESGVADAEEPAGPLWKRVHDDHRIVDGIDGLRFHTCGQGGRQPYATYGSVLPAEGTVLAATVRGDRDVPDRIGVVAWEVGDGRVLGIGNGLSPAAADDEVAATRDRFLRNAVAWVAGEGESPADPRAAPTLRSLRDDLADDPHRPKYHLSPPANWLNDPNGLIHWNGRYHVFYQYNPAGPFHNTIHWGHAVSDDLVTWRDERVALSPSPDGPDRDGCWSGCAVDDDGRVRLVYTGGRGRHQLPCLATAENGDLTAFEKADGNPVIEAPPDDLDVLSTEHWAAEFRDHCVWREDGTWYQIVGSGIEDVGGTALLYESDDLQEWRYRDAVLVGDWDGAGEVWECPELLDLGDAHLLHVSNHDRVEYFIGAFDAEGAAFDPEARGRLDHGDFYAPQSTRDPEGRPLTWGWLWPARSGEAQWDAGWSGTLSLPRRLDVGDDGRLRQRPAPQLRRLREGHARREDLALSDGDRRSLDRRGDALELDVDVRFEGADEFELVVFASPDGEERTAIRCRPDGELVVDRSRSSLDPEAADDDLRMPPREDGERDDLSLSVFLDRSVIEVFAEGRRCLTARVYPTREDSEELAVAASGGAATVESLDVWELGAAWDQQE